MPLGSAVQKATFLGGRYHMVLRKTLLFLVQMEDLIVSLPAAIEQS